MTPFQVKLAIYGIIAIISIGLIIWFSIWITSSSPASTTTQTTTSTSTTSTTTPTIQNQNTSTTSSQTSTSTPTTTDGSNNNVSNNTSNLKYMLNGSIGAVLYNTEANYVTDDRMIKNGITWYPAPHPIPVGNFEFFNLNKSGKEEFDNKFTLIQVNPGFTAIASSDSYGGGTVQEYKNDTNEVKYWKLKDNNLQDAITSIKVSKFSDKAVPFDFMIGAVLYDTSADYANDDRMIKNGITWYPAPHLIPVGNFEFFNLNRSGEEEFDNRFTFIQVNPGFTATASDESYGGGTTQEYKNDTTQVKYWKLKDNNLENAITSIKVSKNSDQVPNNVDIRDYMIGSVLYDTSADYANDDRMIKNGITWYPAPHPIPVGNFEFFNLNTSGKEEFDNRFTFIQVNPGFTATASNESYGGGTTQEYKNDTTQVKYWKLKDNNLENAITSIKVTKNV
jgi:hypothetical protein